jgi:hypothetical protein
MAFPNTFTEPSVPQSTGEARLVMDRAMPEADAPLGAPPRDALDSPFFVAARLSLGCIPTFKSDSTPMSLRVRTLATS